MLMFFNLVSICFYTSIPRGLFSFNNMISHWWTIQKKRKSFQVPSLSEKDQSKLKRSIFCEDEHSNQLLLMRKRGDSRLLITQIMIEDGRNRPQKRFICLIPVSSFGGDKNSQGRSLSWIIIPHIPNHSIIFGSPIPLSRCLNSVKSSFSHMNSMISCCLNHHSSWLNHDSTWFNHF